MVHDSMTFQTVIDVTFVSWQSTESSVCLTDVQLAEWTNKSDDFEVQLTRRYAIDTCVCRSCLHEEGMIGMMTSWFSVVAVSL